MVKIREFRADDIDSVMAVWAQANALAHPFLSDAFVAQTEREVREVYIPSAETYVLQVDGEVVGFISLLGCEIGGLFLSPSSHGKGYGKALVDHAVKLKGPLTVEVFKNNQIGLPFYERCGFECVEDVWHEPSNQISRKMAMPGVRLP